MRIGTGNVRSLPGHCHERALQILFYLWHDMIRLHGHVMSELEPTN